MTGTLLGVGHTPSVTLTFISFCDHLYKSLLSYFPLCSLICSLLSWTRLNFLNIETCQHPAHRRSWWNNGEYGEQFLMGLSPLCLPLLTHIPFSHWFLTFTSSAFYTLLMASTQLSLSFLLWSLSCGSSSKLPLSSHPWTVIKALLPVCDLACGIARRGYHLTKPRKRAQSDHVKQSLKGPTELF